SAFVSDHGRVDRELIAVGRIEGEFGSVEVDLYVTESQWNAVDDPRQGVRQGRDLGGGRVDADRGPDHDVAEVVRPGDRRSDDREAQGRALVGARQVHLAVEEHRTASCARAGGRGSDLARGGTLRVRRLRRPGVAGAFDFGDGAVRAVRNALQR